MKRHVLAAALALALGGAVQAAVIDLTPAPLAGSIETLATAQQSNSAQRPAPAGNHLVVLPTAMSELPEPEVFLMMLLGVILIGYRASRDSSEKFK